MFHASIILKYTDVFINKNIIFFHIKLYLSMRVIIIFFFYHEPVNIISCPGNIGTILFQFLRVIIFELLKKYIKKKMENCMMFG